MRRRYAASRAKKREELLREIAADGLTFVNSGQGHNRAVEAVQALQRIQDGTYGVCIGCDSKIPSARLQVKPEATRCVACQTAHEQGHAGGRQETNHVARRSA